MAELKYVTDIKKAYRENDLPNFIIKGIEITELNYKNLLSGFDKKTAIINILQSANLINERDVKLISVMIDMAFVVGRDKRFIKLIKRVNSCNCMKD